MYPYVVFSLIRKLSGRIVCLFSLSLVLLLVAGTHTSASTLSSSERQAASAGDMIATFTGSGQKPDTGKLDTNHAKEVFTNASSAQGKPVTVPVQAETYETLAYKSVVDNRTSDWNGIWRDTGILLGSQVVAASITLMAPESVSGWSSEEKKNSFKKYGKNFVHPVIDKDKFYINYMLHPYWGATYYTRARERGFDKGSSFLYATAMSTLYEFGAECFYEKPSIQDLIVTPVAGSVLGAYVFEPWRESIKRKQELRWYDHAALIATDPIGVLSLGIEKMFGLKPTIMIDYNVPQLQRASAGSVVASRNSNIGVILQFPLK